MSQAPRNLTISFVDLSINKSIDLFASITRQLCQFIFCLVFIAVIGKIINFFVSRSALEENNKESNQEIDEVESELPLPDDIENKSEIKTPLGWESETIQVPYLTESSSNITAKAIKKQLKRKCMSVGPILLSSELQIIRKKNFDNREERYRYDIIPIDPSTKENDTTLSNKCGLFQFNQSSCNDKVVQVDFATFHCICL